MKIVVFNVGGALATYAENGESAFVIDIGKGNGFSPVSDFLLPLYKKKNVNTKEGRYRISQLIVSHPHKDHISDIQDFNKYFYPFLVTCQNNKYGFGNPYNINWNKIDTPDDDDVKCLKSIIDYRSLPLKPFDTDHMIISYLAPKDVENNKELSDESYTNNISIVTYLDFGKYTVFLPGDLQKLGMESLLEPDKVIHKLHDKRLIKALAEGIDYLICPHHGLRSSFSTVLFSKMKNGKTQKLNIVSEKETKVDDSRIVDPRYSTADYCAGNNNLSKKDSPVYQRKTTNGHIFIDDDGKVEIISNAKTLIDRFI